MTRDRYGRCILTANQLEHVRQARGYVRWLEQTIRRRWPLAQPRWETRGQVSAWVQAGQWVSSCPDCGGGVIVEPGLPMICPDCLNAGNQGYAREVIFPANRGEIETALLARPSMVNQNWLVGEPLTNLHAENLSHGCALRAEVLR